MADIHQNYLLGRQPILDRNEQVVSYEILFRSVASREEAKVSDATRATSNVIINTLSGFGLFQVLGRNKGFINVDLELLMSDEIHLLPRDRIILELLESIEFTPEIIGRCSQLKSSGFLLAIDDHEFDPAFNDLYRIADFVKIDLMRTPMECLPEMVASFKKYQIRLLAEKVEKREDFHRCLAMGFQFFQGYYFAKPSLIEKRRVDESFSALLKLTRVLMEDGEIELVEQAFRRSPGLTYKLLTLVNSVMMGFGEKINSIRHALVILGRKRLFHWVQLCLFAAEKNESISPLMEMAAVRACFMEKLANRQPLAGGDAVIPDHAFITGILSLVETIYDVSMEDVVAILNLPDNIKIALVNREGTLGQFLKIAELLDSTYCRADAEQIELLGFTVKEVLTAQIEAYKWLGSETY